MEIVHQGRGGHIEIDGKRYLIEHIEGGRFAIHFPSGNRHSKLVEHLEALQALVRSDPTKWAIEDRRRTR